MSDTLILTKLCPSCGETLPHDDFGKDVSTRDGLSAYCRQCRSQKSKVHRSKPEVKAMEKTKKAQYYIENKEKICQKTKAYRQRHPEIYKKALQEWHQRNPDYRPNYYLKNREHMLATNAAWLARNPKWASAKQARRRAAVSIRYNVDQLVARLSMFSGCWICGGTSTAIDHVKPLSKGGWDCLSNLRPICGFCNSKKSAKWPFPTAILRGWNNQ